MNTKSSHAAEQNAIYEAAMRSIEASQNRRLANGYAVVGGAIAYGQGALGQGTDTNDQTRCAKIVGS